RRQRRSHRSAGRRRTADGAEPRAHRDAAGGDPGVPRTRARDDDRGRAALARRLPVRVTAWRVRPFADPDYAAYARIASLAEGTRVDGASARAADARWD